MPRRFSDQKLFYLRNYIPIRTVIEDILKIPCRIEAGTFRFGCPVCGQFNTAVNPNTNLARCFICEQSFNPIDMVMAFKKNEFVDAVALLEDQKQTPPPRIKAACPVLRSNNRGNQTISPPTSIGEILSQTIINQPNMSHLQNKIKPDRHSIIHYVEELEKKILSISADLKHLKSIIELK